MKRRRIRFTTSAELLADVDRLCDAPYRRLGRWSLTDMCVHLRLAQDFSVQGFGDVRMPLPARLFGRIARPIILNTGWIIAGVRAPDETVPPAAIDEDVAEIDRFRASVRTVEAFRGPFFPSPFFGKMSPAQWRRFHFVHAAHHLSFLLPQS